MARLIPPAPPSDIPDSERDFFQKLAGEPGTEDWLAFHSVSLSSHYTGHFGEIDFVILIPGRGILCVEVKGGGVRQQDGRWTSIDRHGVTHPLKRSPFVQVQDAMFKLAKALEGRFGKNSYEAKCPKGYVVVFPDVDCPPPSPEFSRGDVIDRRDLEKALAGRLTEAPTLKSSISQSGGASLGAGAMANVRSFLRPDFERIATAGASLRPIEDSIRALTEEQYSFLDAVEYNDRCIVLGPAGSGKTTLALEYARRLSEAGESVLLACFNRLLGQWLKHRVSSFAGGRIVAGSMHKLLDERIRRSPHAAEFEKLRNHEELFSLFYPLYGGMAVKEAAEIFDAVIVDEAQDFHSAALVELVTGWIASGHRGKIVLFGDYEKQAIFGTPGDSLEIARERLAGATIIPLRKNCRNTRRIAVQTSHLASFRNLQLNPAQPDGEAVETWFYKRPEQQGERVEAVLAKLKGAGISPADIVILSKYRRENSGVKSLSGNTPWKVVDASFEAPRDAVSFSTIHAFKGLEAPIVILTDVDDLDEGEGESLLYVAMSRARARLYMLVSDACRPAFDCKVAKGLKELLNG